MAPLLFAVLLLTNSASLTAKLVAEAQIVSCQKFLGDLTMPVALASLNATHILIIEQIGKVQIYNLQDQSMRLLHDITDVVVYDANKHDPPEQRGLLGLAVHPKCFPNCNSFYLFFSSQNVTNQEDHRSIVARLTIQPSGKVVQDRIILNVSQPTAIHNGGSLFFDEEGFLFISTGDSGRRSDSFRITSFLGKLLRVNVDEGSIEVYASGFQNPWRCFLDVNRIICGDVGEHENEDRILIVERSDIHGWHYAHDSPCKQMSMQTCNAQRQNLYLTKHHKFPVHIHGKYVPSAVIGGVFVNGCRLPSLNNRYIYGDYVNGTMHTLREDDANMWDHQQLHLHSKCSFTRSRHFILSFGEDYWGNVYVLTMATKDDKVEGIIYKLISSPNENAFCDGFLVKSGVVLVPLLQIVLITHTSYTI